MDRYIDTYIYISTEPLPPRLIRLPRDAATVAAAAEATEMAAAEAQVMGAEGFGGMAVPAKEGYAVYSTYDKVVGLVRLPFDGNPSQVGQQ